MKLSREMSSENPLHKVCIDLHELMLQHFTESDVLKASEVSPEWMKTISISPKCMSKIPLKFEFSRQVPKEMSESRRQYSDLNVHTLHLEPAQISQQKFKMVEKLAPFLKKLQIFSVSGFVYEQQNLQLPKLESLEITSNGLPIIFVNTTKLKKLSLWFHHFNLETIEWIEKQENLEELKLEHIYEDFFYSPPKLPKGIKRFECSSFDLQENQASKLNNFLEPMCETLTSLTFKVYSIFPTNIEFVVNQMPELISFELFYYDLKDMNTAKLRSNKNITKLKISKFVPKIQYLLLSLLNLEELEIKNFQRMYHSINIADFEWIARNLMKLKKLSSPFTPSEEAIVERYNEMKANEEGINKEIEIIVLYPEW
jgi:hypothetical protein